MEMKDLYKATLICSDEWYDAAWSKCTNCPLFGEDNCMDVLSTLQRIFIRDYIEKDEEK